MLFSLKLGNTIGDETARTANNALLQAGQTCLNESVVLLIKFSACGQVGASIAPPDNKP